MGDFTMSEAHVQESTGAEGARYEGQCVNRQLEGLEPADFLRHRGRSPAEDLHPKTTDSGWAATVFAQM